MKQRLHSVRERLWTAICQEHSMCGWSSCSKKNSLDNLLGFQIAMAFNMIEWKCIFGGVIMGIQVKKKDRFSLTVTKWNETHIVETC